MSFFGNRVSYFRENITRIQNSREPEKSSPSSSSKTSSKLEEEPSQDPHILTLEEELQENLEHAHADKPTGGRRNQRRELFMSTQETALDDITTVTSDTAVCVESIGGRVFMQDVHCVQTIGIDGQRPLRVYAVFDGHGGVTEGGAYSFPDEFDQFYKEVLKELPGTLENLIREELQSHQFEEAIHLALKRLGGVLNEKTCVDGKGHDAGTCLCLCVRDGNELWTANIGDSRAVRLKADGTVEALSEDAKPTNPRYEETIKKLGGTVVRGRVGMNLAVARALGDLDTKGVCPDAVITKVTLKEGDTVLIASDGLWDRFLTEEMTSVMQYKKDHNLTLEQTLQRLVWSCCQTYQQDNTTVMAFCG